MITKFADTFFPADFAKATWGRLMPFFELSGQVQRVGDETVVELQPFYNRQFNRDLTVLCAKVEERAPIYPALQAYNVPKTLYKGPHIQLDAWI